MRIDKHLSEIPKMKYEKIVLQTMEWSGKIVAEENDEHKKW